jgi:hypothetical protein
MESMIDGEWVRPLARGLAGLAVAFGIAACAAGNPPAPVVPAAESQGAPLATEPVVEAAEAPATEPAEAPATEPAVSPPVDPPLAGGEIHWKTKEPAVAVPSAWRSCSAPDDCQLVMATCCDECNGGEAVSVAKSRVADARAKFKPTGCGACTKRGCATRAFCEAGRCVLQWPAAR